MKPSTLSVVAIALALGTGCGPKREQYEFRGRQLGTSYTVKVVARVLSEQQRGQLRRAIEGQLDEVNARMSTYRPSSELSRFNRFAGAGAFPVSPEMLRVLTAARRIGQATHGAFDITVAPLVDAWGFGPPGIPAGSPPETELKRLEKLTGWDKITIDETASTIRKAAPGVRCDLSGIAKGYAVDRVAGALSRRGFGDYMVEVGGEVRTSGHNQAGRLWRIGIEKPISGGRAIERVVALENLAMATSGDYRNYYERNGVRLSHIIDPRTGRPIGHRLASVSVVAPECMVADGYATGLMVLGDKQGYPLAVAEHLAVLFLVRDRQGNFQQKATPEFGNLFGRASQGVGKPSPAAHNR